MRACGLILALDVLCIAQGGSEVSNRAALMRACGLKLALVVLFACAGSVSPNHTKFMHDFGVVRPNRTCLSNIALQEQVSGHKLSDNKIA